MYCSWQNEKKEIDKEKLDMLQVKHLRTIARRRFC